MSGEKVYYFWDTSNPVEGWILFVFGVIALMSWLGFFNAFVPRKERKLEKIKEKLVNGKPKVEGKTLSEAEQLFYDNVIRYEQEIKEARTEYQVAKENLLKKQEEFEALLYAEKKRREGGTKRG